jgi:5-methylcytosine-specific restriction endonuclease McrA
MAHKDPVTPELRRTVINRDKTCIGPRIGMPKECGTQFGPGTKGPVELDHVVSSGFGKRGPSIEENLVAICGFHHRMKTEASKTWRPKIIEYLEKFYGQND